MAVTITGSEFVLDACEAFTRAQSQPDPDLVHLREIFLRVANRCAQLEIWLDHQHGDAAPDEHDPCWEAFMKAREART